MHRCVRIPRAGALAILVTTFGAGAHAQTTSPSEPRPVRLGGFVVGSMSYLDRSLMIPEFAGGAPTPTEPHATNFAFDKFGLAAGASLSSWLSASGAVEVESHRDRHVHGFDPVFGCPGTGLCREQFGAEEPSVEVNLDRFSLTAVVPIGTGLALSLGRFDVPFGFERHDEPLLLTATTSEIFRYARPQRMTGLQAHYAASPVLDMTAWVVNRWESETSGAEDFNDVNHGKSVGGRVGVTPIQREGLLNFGLGAFYGPEQADDGDHKRWVVDFDATWSPSARLVLTTEAVTGGEDQMTMRRRGVPIPAPRQTADVGWRGLTVLAHYDLVDPLGVTLRYGVLDDRDGGRTGVVQRLASWTVAPILHLSRMASGLRPMGALHNRTRHPIDAVDLRVELRIDRSNVGVFSDAEPGQAILQARRSAHQVLVQLVWNF